MPLISKYNGKCVDVVHPWTTSCSFASFEIFYHIFQRSIKIYGSVYLIAALARRKNVEYLKKKLFWEVVQSTVFLSLNGSLFCACLCSLRKLLGNFTVLTAGIFPASLASYVAIITERPERRGLLALYMLNNAIECIFNMLVHRNIITSVSHGEVYMFCCATAMLMYLYRTKTLSNGFLNRVLRFFLGEDKQYHGHTSARQDLDSVQNVNTFLASFKFRDILRSIIPTAKTFSFGYAMEAIPRLLRCLFSPTKIPKALVNKNNFKLGCFLGSFVALFQCLEFLLHRLRKKRDDVNSFIAGAVSGTSLLFYRSSTISLYLLTKVAEILFKNAQNQGLLPVIPYAEIIVYTLSTAFTFHVCIFEYQNVRPSYWRFLNHVTNNRILPATKIVPKIEFK